MVGKLDLDMGEDYAYDIRRAKYVAEQAQAGGGGLKPGEQAGPFYTSSKVPYWFRVGARGAWYVGFDLDADPEPDLFVSLKAFLSNPSVDQQGRDEVQAQAEALGWQG